MRGAVADLEVERGCWGSMRRATGQAVGVLSSQDCMLAGKECVFVAQFNGESIVAPKWVNELNSYRI